MVVASSRTLITEGPGRAAAGALKANPGHGHVVVEPYEVLLESDLRPIGQLNPGAEGIVGDRQQGDGHAKGAGQLAGHLAQGGALGQTLGPVAVGGQVLITEVEPGDPAQLPE